MLQSLSEQFPGQVHCYALDVRDATAMQAAAQDFIARASVPVITICSGYIKMPMTAINPYPMPFILPADEAARRIARAIEHGKLSAVIPWQMGLVGHVLRLMPNWLHGFLFSKAPHTAPHTGFDCLVKFWPDYHRHAN